MARLQVVVANLLCHEAVSFLIYGTVMLLLVLYIPHWIRQKLDRQYLKVLAKKAREKHNQQRMELMQKSPECESIGSAMIGYEDDDERERRREIEYLPLVNLERDSDDKLSFLSHDVSRHTQEYQM